MKRTNRIKTFLIVIITLAMAILFSGCSSSVSSGEQPEVMVVVYGHHANFPFTEALDNQLREQLFNCFLNDGTAYLVVVDGESYLAAEIQPEEHDGVYDRKTLEMDADDVVDVFLEIAKNSPAKTPEVNTLSAIQLAADIMSSVPQECKKNIIVVDSGVSTISPLNFCEQSIWYADADSIVDQLEAAYEIPDLSGCSVHWIGLGQTSDNQTSLTRAHLNSLKQIWSAVLEASNCLELSFSNKPFLRSTTTSVCLPFVTAVSISSDDIYNADFISIPEDKISFYPNSSLFTDEETVREYLQPIKDFLQNNPDQVLYLFGSTATTPDTTACFELSAKRAERCAELLISMGVDPGQLLSYGLGCSNHVLRTADTDASGTLIEKQAQHNRCVYFIKNKQLAEKLIQVA